MSIRYRLSEAAAIRQELTALRERLHRHPERGNSEFRTADTVEKWLHDCGIETKRLTETAVMGTLRFSEPGGCVALRADMDALPLTEETGAACASEESGMMHACGHDIHMTCVLGAAKLLSKLPLRGEVRFLFQPDEEMNGGARRMVAAGAMNGVDAVFGGHVDPGLPAGTVGVRYGKFYAASDMFNIRITGKAAHGATPEKGIDALAAGAKLVTALKSIPERFSEHCVVTVGSFHAGTARNILSGEAELKGIMRTLGPDTRSTVRAMLRDEADRIAKETGTKIDVELIESYPGVVNNDVMTERAEAASKALFGDERVIRIAEPTMTTEDFGYFLDEAPGSFVHFGVGGEWPLHNPKFFPDSETAVNGAALFAAVVESELMK